MAILGADKVPAFLGGDLSDSEQSAYLEGHDADLDRSQHQTAQRNTGTDTHLSNIQHRTHHSNPAIDIDMHDPDKHGQSSATSISDSPAEATHDLEKVVSAVAGHDTNPNIVFWDSDTDPANPLNWTARNKWIQIAVLSGLTFLTPLASSFFAPAVPELMREFGSDSNLLATFVVSVYVLGFAVGPLVIAPLSELYGRLWVYHICNVGFIGFTIACSRAQSIGELCAYRFLQGCWGVCPVTIGGGTIADLMVVEKRGGAMAIWALGPLLGPVIGPVCGGFLSEAKSWRWIFYVIAMATGAIATVAIFTLRETYAPVLLERKAAKLRKETGNSDLRSKLDNGLNPKQLFLRAIVRPTKILFLSPICALMTLYMSIVYGFLYLLFTTFTFVFEDSYGFSPSIVGLVYIALGIGNFIGLALLGFAGDRYAKALANKHSNGVLKPEYRLPPLMYLGPLIPAGLFIYGWAAQYEIQWAVPLFGTLLVGMGLIACFMCINTYLVDTYTLYAASAMAANTILRSIFGGVFPLFGLSMYDSLGLGWGNSLLAFLAAAMLPIPFVFYRYGERIRTHPKWQVQF